jgi:hypothetical protein
MRHRRIRNDITHPEKRHLSMPADAACRNLLLRETFMRCALFFAAMLVASSATCAETIYRFDIVNASARTIVTVAVAPAGGAVFRKAVDELRKPVRLGRGESMTITTRPSEGGCLRDVRVSFDDGREAIDRNLDICRRDVSYAAAP